MAGAGRQRGVHESEGLILSSFIYYVGGMTKGHDPASHGYLSDELASVIGYDTPQTVPQYVPKGPDDGEGCLIITQPSEGSTDDNGEPLTEPQHGYKPDIQTWVPAYVPGKSDPEYWIGWETKRKPTPAALIRRKTFAGHYVTLADGNQWLIPEVGPYPKWCKLPLGYEVGKDGQMKLVAIKQFRAVFEESQRWADVYDGGGNFFLDEAMAFAAKVLGVNYRVGVRHLGLDVLGAVTSEVYRDIVRAATGVISYEAEQLEKSVAATP